ncbi:MAG TPA: methionyl-tRNA formyltransferase [Burkholderiales bacterium]|nr:methionyl-tRNA formyltransferase [Burkholderiales bacterium]
MKLIFAGTPDFAAAALRAVHAAGHEVALVLTQPDRPAGRGLQPQPSAVRKLADQLGLPVAQPQTLRDPAVVAQLAALDPEVMVVAAYGLILPRDALAVPRRGCINIHASLLPRWRGAAPIQRALLAGDRATGISIMRMDEGLDTGPVLMDQAIAIEPHDTAQTLHDRLAALGAELIVRALAEQPEARPQDHALATYASKIDKGEARLDWRDPAHVNERKVRAFNPAPGAATTYGDIPLKIWAATIAPAHALAPGTVSAADSSGITVACGEGALRITELQRAGGRRVPAAAFLAGCRISPGERLGQE